jgi:hypothetical protein
MRLLQQLAALSAPRSEPSRAPAAPEGAEGRSSEPPRAAAPAASAAPAAAPPADLRGSIDDLKRRLDRLERTFALMFNDQGVIQRQVIAPLFDNEGRLKKN